MYHKSYRKPEPIVVTFTREKMEINSIPGPDRTIKKADLERFRLFAKQDRNRRIGDFLKELELAESRNTGYPAILRAVEQNGSPMPVIETNPNRDYFTFVLPVHKYFLQSNAKTVRELNPDDAIIALRTDHATVPVPYQYRTSTAPVADPVPASVRKLLLALQDGPRSPLELRTAVGIQHRRTFRENYINPAIRADLICAEGGLSPHDPRIRYSLTDRGRLSLNGIGQGNAPFLRNGTVEDRVGEINDGIKDKMKPNLVCAIQVRPGMKRSEIHDFLNISFRTLDRMLATLIAEGIVEHRGSKKTGGYYVRNDK